MARPCSVFIVFLLKLVLGDCGESNEEVHKEVDDYDPLINGIPTLFENLIAILEERPEILEKDDVTSFQEQSDACDGNNRRKRNVREQCGSMLASDDQAVENNIMNDVNNVIFSNTDTDHLSEVVTEKTQTKTERNGNDLETKLSLISKTKTNKPGRKEKVKGEKKYFKTDIVRKKNKAKGNKRNDKTSFLGTIDWNKLYLSPEEVAEQTLKVEQAIEDHNKKKER